MGEIFGLSTQDTAYQKEAATRLGLTFELLSDGQLAFAQALNLPTFVADGMTLRTALLNTIIDKLLPDVSFGKTWMRAVPSAASQSRTISGGIDETVTGAA